MQTHAIKQAFDSLLEVKPPVDFRTFVESPDYMGITGIYEWWFDHLNPRIDKSISRVCFRGSTGGGKTTLMNLLCAYKLYLLFLQGPDPAKTLGLLAGTNVYFIYFSINLTQAKRSGFAQLRDFIDGSEWFKKNYPRDKQIDSSIRFSNHFSIESASGEQHQIGLNVWGFILDEANFRKEVSGEGSASEFEDVYRLAARLETRLAQRFLRNGIENFFAAYISSASYDTSFIQDKGDDLKDNPNAIVLDPVLYKVDPSRYSQNRFEVFFGFGEVPPCVVKDAAHKEALKKSLATLSLTGDFIDTLFEQVPLELKFRFEGSKDANIYMAIQDICGRPTAVRGSFVTNYDIIRDSYNSDAPSPFAQDFVTVSNKIDIEVKDAISVNVEAIEHRNNPHSLFLDLSTQGDYGSLTCVRFDGLFGGVKYHTHVFTLEFIPPQFPAATDITKIQRFIIWLASIMNIKAFGSDQFQCFAGDTLIPTTKGVKPIRDIQVGDKVFSHTGVCNVVNKFRYENAPVVRVRTKRHKEFVCTPNHKMSVVKWCHKQLSKEHIVRVGKGTTRTVVRGKVYEYPDILARDFLPASSLYKKALEQTPQLFIDGSMSGFSLGLSVEWAEYIGWMTGDGGISLHKDGRSIPYLVCNKDEWDIIEDLNYRVTGLHKEKPKKARTSYCITLASRLSKEYVKHFPKSYKSTDKDIPTFIENAPLHILSAFLRGLFSSDGSCSKEAKSVVLTTVSIKLATSVRRVLEYRYGITCNISKVERGYKGDFPTKNPFIYRVYTCGPLDHFVQIGFIQQYKLDNLCDALSCVGKGVMDHVSSIEPIGFDTVYDIEVDSPDHSYYTCDFLSHNSSQLRQEVSKALGLPDIRISLDSTDVPHLLWLSACASHRFHMKKYERQDREICEAVHDLKRRRVVKRKGSTDDQFQTLVGAFYLSETVGSTGATIPERMNVVGGKSAQRVLSQLGYTGGVQTDPNIFMRRVQQEERQRASTRSKFESAFDELFNQ